MLFRKRPCLAAPLLDCDHMALSCRTLQKSGQSYLEQIDRIAKQNASKLPFLFGKWEFFKKEGLRDLMASLIQDHLNIVSFRMKKLSNDEHARKQGDIKFKVFLEAFYKDQAEAKYKEAKELNEELLKSIINVNFSQNLIYEYVFFGLLYLKDQEGRRSRSNILPIWMKDPELKAYLTKKLADLEEDYTNALQDIKKWKAL
jgi:hypothetical protein